MKQLSIIVLFLALLTIGPACNADVDEGALDAILLNEVRVNSAGHKETKDDTLVLVVDVREERAKGVVHADYLSRLMKHQLDNAGFRNRIYTGEFKKDLRERLVGTTDLLAPKLVLDVQVYRDDSTDAYGVKCAFGFIEYVSENPEATRFRAKKSRMSQQDMRGISREELEDDLTKYVQKEMTAFLKGKALAKKFSQGSRASHAASGEKTSSSSGSGSVGYSLRWHDPDHKRNHFLVGATVGTPALLNLHFGFWGSRSLPIVAGISGMYFGKGSNGVQFDTGWAIANTGDFRQVIGMAVTAFTEKKTGAVEQFDDFGRSIQTLDQTNYLLMPYVGPVYTMDWKSLRLQAGAAFRVRKDAESNVRFLFQIGYTPPWDL